MIQTSTESPPLHGIGSSIHPPMRRRHTCLIQEAMAGGHYEGLQGTISGMIRRIAMAGGDKITVLNPMGYPPSVTHKPLAPRLETLDGKTVYLVDCRFD